MRPPFRSLPAFVAAIGPVFLTGCDAAVAGFFLPGLGRPMTGRVVDARTHLPVGGATVLAGLGSTVTDGDGRFRLLGNFGSREISVGRAGYVAVTMGGVSPDPGGELQFALEPLFPATVTTPNKFLTLEGPVSGLPQSAPAMVTLSGKQATVSNNFFNVQLDAGIPGRMMTSVLAWGALSDAYVENGNGPFHFLNFNYIVGSWPMADTVPASRQAPIAIAFQPTSPIPIIDTKIAYGNLDPTKFSGVQTDVLLDFGVVGYVPVARALASSQQLKVPRVEGLKYVITGEARSTSGKASSLVMLTTNDPGKATFQLLSVPTIEGPPSAGAGQRPTFAWTPVPGEVNYEVELYEVGEGKPKWVGRTDQPEITYPAFAPNDVNGGALRPEKKYSWSLRVIDLLDEDETPTAARRYDLLGVGALGPVPVKPYRVRQREVIVRDNGFSL